MHDQLATGQRLRVLTIVDTFSWFSPALEPRFTFRDADVVDILENVAREILLPATIRVDQGTEFVSRDLDLFHRSFQRRFRVECLNAHWFLSFAEALHDFMCAFRFWCPQLPIQSHSVRSSPIVSLVAMISS